MITLKVPATTANLGPGFDVFGLALRLYLTVTVRPHDRSQELVYRGRGVENITVGETNLLWRTIMQVASRHDATCPNLTINVHNDIPLGRGLGSSGAAVVAGVMIANEVCGLNLTREQLVDAAIEIESHPDNITAALMGGLVACCVTEEGHALAAAIPVSDRIKAVVVVPDFELPTVKARAVLPAQYSRADSIFNLQRVALLAAALATDEPHLIKEAMRDRLHQPYRKPLVPSLDASLDLGDIPGLLGVSLSGAGPSILALAVDHFAEIGGRIESNFRKVGIGCEVLILDVDPRGAEISGDWAQTPRVDSCA